MPPSPCFYAHHELSHFIGGQFTGFGDLLYASVINNCDGIRTIHDLIQFQRDQKDCFALVSLCNDLLVDILYGTDIQSTGGLHKDHQGGILFHFSGNNGFLLITTTHGTYHCLAALAASDIVFFYQFSLLSSKSSDPVLPYDRTALCNNYEVPDSPKG